MSAEAARSARGWRAGGARSGSGRSVEPALPGLAVVLQHRVLQVVLALDLRPRLHKRQRCTATCKRLDARTCCVWIGSGNVQRAGLERAARLAGGTRGHARRAQRRSGRLRTEGRAQVGGGVRSAVVERRARVQRRVPHPQVVRGVQRVAAVHRLARQLALPEGAGVLVRGRGVC